MADASNTSTFRYEEGIIIRHVDGKDIPVASFDETSGILTYEDADARKKYSSQIAVTIGSKGDGTDTQATGRTIKRVAIKGQVLDKIPANAPTRPKQWPSHGEATPAYVEWMFKWAPQEAYILYGVKLDGDGKPVRADCKRVFSGIINTDKAFEIGGEKEYVKAINGGVYESKEARAYKDVIIADRATHMTFLQSEITGHNSASEMEDNWSDVVSGGEFAPAEDNK